MDERPFERSITVDDPQVGHMEIASAKQALDYLGVVGGPFEQRTEWALNRAQAALDGTCSTSDARVAFVEAARQAGVLVFD